MSNLDGLPKANMSGSRCPILAAYPHMASLPIPHGLPNTALPAASCPVLSSPASAIAAGAARAQANHTQTAFAPSSSSASSTSSAPARKGATPPAPGSPFSFPSPSPSPIPSPEKISLFNVMDDLLECVVVADANGTILRANSAAQTLFGYSSAELLGQNVAMLCEPEIARIHQRFLDRYLSTRRPVVIGTAGRDVRGQHKNGALIPLRLSVAETRHMGHTLFIAQLHDLRPIKQREEELRVFSQLNKTVAERTSAEIHERIMHSVAHELRNPLQTISGSLFQLRTSLANLSNSDSELLSDIQTAIVRCCSVLDNAVLVCNYQTRKLTQDPSFERADVRDSLESVRQQLRFYTTAPIRVEVDSSVPQEAFFNLTHTRQILKYAMANAMKHTLHGEMVLRASVVPNVRARKTDLSPSDSANQDLLRLEIQYCCHLGSRSSFADSAAWLFPVSAKLTEATSFSDPDLPVPPLSTKSTRVDSSRPASALPSPSSDSDSSENSSPSITPLSDCVGSSADSNSVASQPLTPAALPVVPVSLASVSSAPRASSTQPQPLSSTTAPAITSTNPPALASYHIHQKTQRATSDSAGIVSDFVSRCPHMDAAYVPRGSATDSPTADADSEMRGRTERMLEMTNQLVAAMGGTCALQILGCRDLEVDPAVQSHLTPTSCLANNHRVVHFTDKRFWFTVPFNYTARTVTEEERQSSSLVEAVSRLLSLGAQEKKDSITAHAPPASAFRLSTFNSDGTTSAVSLTSALAVASLQDTKLNKRVLFVDDEVTIGKMAARYLQKLGCTHTVLTDGDQVMAELERKQYDIVLLDIVMPRLNGEDACALIRAKYPELPVIAATANTSAQDQTRYRQVGFNGCLAKPYSINDMRAAIVKWTSDMELYGNEFIVPNGLKHSGSAPSIQPQPVKS